MVVDVDPETGVWKVRRMVALDDCGVRINPMIVEGQIHGGLTEGFATSSMQWITFDDDGNCIGSNFMDYLIPTAWETPRFELLETCVPSPHHPIGAKGVGESATVGSPAAYVNAVIDALAHLGVRNIDMPLLPDRVWSAIQSGERLMDERVLAEAVALTGARRPFALATVVWRRAPSSGRVGSKAIVFPDGRVHGWLGGACAEPTVVREALAALSDDRARLLFLGPADELARHARDDTITVPMACESEGALEVYIEPFLPGPQLVIVGRSPAVHTLAVQAACARLGRRRGRRRRRRRRASVPGTRAHHARPRGPRRRPDDARSSIATQGHYDDRRARAALATDAGYIGVDRGREALVVAASVAARRRRRRRAAGTGPRARRSRPRGHRRTPRSRSPCSPTSSPAAPRASYAAARSPSLAREAIDPVCGMTVYVDDAKYHTVHDGTDYYFCAAGCQRAFEAQTTEPA